MIMREEYLFDVEEYVKELPEELCQNKKAVLDDNDVMENLRTSYQKKLENGCDEEWSIDEAAEEVLHLIIPRHHYKVECPRVNQYKKLLQIVLEIENCIPSEGILLSAKEYELAEEIANMRDALMNFL